VTIVLRRALVPGVLLSLFACAGAESPTAPATSFQELGVESPAAEPSSPLVRLSVPTYDGSGQAVHPDIVWFPKPWHGWEYWMAFTPYPRGQERFENPSIVVSHDGVHWQVPAGLSNPLVGSLRKPAFNSDPDLSYDAAHDRLVLIYREVRAGFNNIFSISSQDGVVWGGRSMLFRRRNHGMISPTIVIPSGGPPKIWYVDGGRNKCLKRVTRVMRQTATAADALAPSRLEHGWSFPRAAGLEQKGYMIWHLDVVQVPAKGEYWALYPAYTRRGCGTRDLFFARSRDGVNWTTYPIPLLRHEDERWTSVMLYRASALYDESRDVVRIFLSAQGPGPDWRLGLVEFKYDELIAALEGRAAVPGISHQLIPAGAPFGRLIDEDAMP
jgi:hypothetical protein